MTRSILFRRTIAALVSVLSIVPVSVAQFTVVSSSPADGDTSVPLNSIVTLTFSAPLDTTAAFEDTDGFFLNIETIPETDPPSSYFVSTDGTTFGASLVFEADTKYLVLLSGARSTSGDPLDEPFVATFTTGATLPSGTISGTVTEALTKQQPEGAVVAVFPDDPVTGLFGSEEGNPVGATLVGAGGAYTINYVEDGSYTAVSIKDGNKDGLLDFTPDDPFGLYDSDNDSLIDAFSVESGGAVGGIDIVITAVEPVTARGNLGAAQTIAEATYSDAVLTSVAADLDASGRSVFWIYLFYSASASSNLGLVNLGSQFAPSAIFDDGGGAYDIMTPLPEGWLDSDMIVGIANENGGSDFLTQWEDVEIFGSGANFTGSFGKRSQTPERLAGRSTGFGAWRPSQWSFGGALSKTSSPTPTPIWFLSYDAVFGGPFDFLFFMIHAVTGDIDPPLESYTSGRENLDAANALAAAWASDAGLVKVESGFSGVHRSGLSSQWYYTYFSEAATKTERVAARTFVMEEGALFNEMAADVGSLFSTEVLPEMWIDTPAITSTADANSDDFRGMNPNSFVQSVLSKGLISWDLSRPVWQYEYFGSSGVKTVLVNAVTGGVIVSTEDEEVPSSLTLDQNYPNPFNPSTTIAYDVPASGGVTIRVFDALGRQVRLLVDRSHTPGKYTVVWDGRDDAGTSVSSGIYIYKLEAGAESETRSMILLR